LGVPDHGGYWLVVDGTIRPSSVIAKALSAGFVRREALPIRVEAKDHHCRWSVARPGRS